NCSTLDKDLFLWNAVIKSYSHGHEARQAFIILYLMLKNKGLSGQVSPTIVGLKCLSSLYLHYNSLSGEIPKELSNLQELIDLYLNDNNCLVPFLLILVTWLLYKLTGNIPTEIGDLKGLSVISLQRNRLDGKILASLENLVMLRRLYLSYNSLFGEIPTILANILQLETLDVRKNTLYGNVPS
ncbi:hypothetical protein Goklo_023216, partial [Gossypium klotzschianum]|nr:hypothetical protein [Gossypium klotzschianum]